MTIKDWLETAKAESEKVKKKLEEESKYFKLDEGENLVPISLAIPPQKIIDSFNRNKYRFATTKDKSLDVTEKLYTQIIDKLSTIDSSAGIVNFKIKRTGEGMQTRYELLDIQPISQDKVDSEVNKVNGGQ